MSLKRALILLVKNSLLALVLLVTATLSALTTMRSILTAQEVQVPSLIDKRVPDAAALASRQRLLLRVEGKRHDPKVPTDRIAAQEPLAGSTLKSHRSIRVWLSLGPRRLTLPAVEGQGLRTARLTLEQAQLSIARVAEVDDPAVDGTVLVQRPPAGEVDEISEGVALLVSRGPASADYLMPDLIGRRAEDVLEALQRAGLKVADVRYRSYPGAGPGIVLRQTPAAGHRVNRRNPVSLEVSKAMS